MLNPALTHLKTAAEAVVLSAQVNPIIARLLAPHRTVLVGRVGVGKTTLANRWANTSRPTGLGGVTQIAVELQVGGTTVVDTPGIDRTERAIVDLGPILASADSLIWVVDGLQPLTASERHVVDATAPPDLPAQILVSRADLLSPDDIELVVKRARSLTGVPVLALDLRNHPLPTMPSGPAPEKQQQAATALRQLVETLPPALGLANARVRLRERIRKLVAELRGEVQAGHLGHKVDALTALHERGPQALHGLPPLPAPARPDQDRVSRLLGGLSGIEGADRLLKAGAASWLAEAQLALVEAYEVHPEWETHATNQEAFKVAANQVLSVLTP